MGFRVYGLGCLGFRVTLGFRVEGLGLGVWKQKTEATIIGFSSRVALYRRKGFHLKFPTSTPKSHRGRGGGK